MPKRRGFKPSEHFEDRLRKMRERGARDGVAPASRARSKAASVGGPFLVAAATDFFAFDRRNGLKKYLEG